MTEVNVPLLRKTVEWVEEQAALHWRHREWRQSDWVSPPPGADTDGTCSNATCRCCEPQRRALRARATGPACGTAYCLAGYIGHLDGVLATIPVIARDGTVVEVETDRTTDGEHVSRYAARRLGLTGETEHPLFNASNTAQEIRRIAEKIAGEPL